MRKLLLLGFFFKCVDVMTTYYMVSISDHSVEANPFVAWTIRSYGNLIAMILNILLFILLMLTAYQLNAKKAIIIGVILVTCVSLWNTIGLLLFII